MSAESVCFKALKEFLEFDVDTFCREDDIALELDLAPPLESVDPVGPTIPCGPPDMDE